MSVPVTMNGVVYTIPETSNTNWGGQVTAWIQSASSGTLQKTGGSFILTAEVDFGATYGLKAAYFKSKSTNPAGSGTIRLSNADSVSFRNAANSGDLPLNVSGSDKLNFNAIEVVDVSSTQTLTNKTLTAPVISGGISGLTKADVGLGNVDNTSDATKNAASATLTNKTLTAPVINAPTGIVKGDVGLSNVDNTSDVNKPVSTATQTALNLKYDASNPLDFMEPTSVDTMTNKTFGDAPTFTQVATPASPSAGLNKIYPKSDGKFYTLDSAGLEVQIGSGSGGGVNLLSANPDFESGTTGYAAYNNTSAPAPVTGTGGSPLTTITRSTSSPLNGTASGLITKPGSDRRGDGISYDMTVPLFMRGTVATLSCDYQVNSGTFVTGDVAVWFYDVTNSQVIQPSGSSVVSVGSGINYKQISQVQIPLTCTSLRVCFHVATVSALAYALKIDNLSFGPQAIAQGTPVTDWKEYPMIITASSVNPTKATSPSVDKAFWRRVGDSVEIMYSYTGNTTGAASGSGTYRFNLPAGLTIDSTKVGSVGSGIIGNVGIASGYDNGASALSGYVLVETTTSLSLQLGNYILATTSVGSGNVPMSTVDTRYSFTAKVPIVGWSSNVAMSDSSDTRVCVAKALGDNAQTFSSGATAKLNLATTVNDTHGGMDLSTDLYTCKVPGYYNLVGQIGFTTGGTAPSSFNAHFLVNNTGILLGRETISDMIASKDYTCQASAQNVWLNAGDTVQLNGLSSTQAVTMFGGTGSEHSYMAVQRVTGPSQIAASELVKARCTTAAGQSIPNNSTTIIDFGTKTYDSHGSVTTGAAWKFTCVSPGNHSVGVLLTLNGGGGWAAGEFVKIELFKNGSSYAIIGYWAAQATHTSIPSIFCGEEIDLITDDYIDIRVTQNSGAALTVLAAAPYNHVAIKRNGF